MSKALVVDCQVLQTITWDRGMGKYTYNLLKGLHEVYDGEVHLLFNTNLPRNEAMRSLVAKELKKFTPHDISLLIPGNRSVGDLQAKNVVLLDKALDSLNLNAEDTAYFIPCLFLWPACAVFPSGTTNVLLMHDIIPLLYHDRYFPTMRVDDYLAQYKIIFEADRVVTVSQSVCDDLQVYLGLESKRTSAINGASVVAADMPERVDLSKDYKKPYVFMPTGNDIRKNNQRAVNAFESYLKESGKDLELVISSFFTDFEKQELRRLSPHIRFCGNVTDDELAWLFKNSECLLFPSESEGLGLPMLDAVMVDQKVICSDIPVFREISANGFYFADPYNPDSIKEALAKALEHKSLSDDAKKEYKRIKKEFTWENVASRLVKQLSLTKKTDLTKPRKRIAILGPKPSSYSAIGKTLLELHPALSRRFDIDYYLETSIVEDKYVRPNHLKYAANCYEVKDFNAKRYREYDAVVYHMGNSENHLLTAQHALALPGIMIVHDTHMPNIYRFLREEGYMDQRRIALEEQLNEFVTEGRSSFITSLVNSQLGIIMHSEYAKQTIMDVLENEVALKRGNLTFANPSYNVQDRNRDKVHIGLGGILASVKGLELVEQIAGMPEFSDCIIEVFGFNFAETGVLERIQQYSNIRLSTNLTDQEFQMRLASLDILLNYRMEYRGETSCTVLESMRYGVVPVVRNIGWYGELPDDCAVKIDSLDDVVPTLHKLVEDKQLRRSIGTAGKQMIERGFLHEYYATVLDELIDEITVADDLSRKPLATGIHANQSLQRLLGYVE